VMGDWATVLEASSSGDEGCTYPTPQNRVVDQPHVAIRPFPGTENAFVYASDVVVSRVDLSDSEDPKSCIVRSWFEDVASDPEILADYWRLKGSIPPQPEATMREPSDYQENAAARYAACRDADSNCRLLRAVSAVARPSPLDSSAGGAGGAGGMSGLGEKEACEEEVLSPESSLGTKIEDLLQNLWNDLKDCPGSTEFSQCRGIQTDAVAPREDQIRRVLNDTIEAGVYCP
jgi:hypothetical protein